VFKPIPPRLTPPRRPSNLAVMTTTTDLIGAALEVADLFRSGDTPDQPEIRWLVRAADQYKATGHEPDGCPACIVRALTEGESKTWFPSEPASVKGVVLWVGTTPTPMAMGMLAVDTLPVVDLWLGGTDRIRIVGYGSVGRDLYRLAPTVGDTLTVAYTGQGTIEGGKYAGRAYRNYTVEIVRGHH